MRRVAFAPLLAIAAMGAGVWAWARSTAPDDPWGRLAARCATFERVRVTFAFDDTDRSRAFQAYATGDGRLGVDEFNGYNTRFAWASKLPFTKHWRNQPHKKVVAGAGAMLDDLWEECRRGFARSDWTIEAPDPKMRGAWRQLRWARLHLPFAWAEGAPVWVGVNPEDDTVRRVVVERPEKALVVTIAEVAWEAELPEDATSPWSPTVGPKKPAVFRQGLRTEDLVDPAPTAPAREAATPPADLPASGR